MVNLDAVNAPSSLSPAQLSSYVLMLVVSRRGFMLDADARNVGYMDIEQILLQIVSRRILFIAFHKIVQRVTQVFLKNYFCLVPPVKT